VKKERAEDDDQVAQMLVRVADAERALAEAQRAVEASQIRTTTAEEKAAVLATEVTRLKERCERLEADAWDPVSVRGRDRVAAVREAMVRVGALLEELDRREEMAAGIRSRTMEQLRQALSEVEGPTSPPVQPMPVVDLGSIPPGGREPHE
jgi:septal ring factor EnvC (AmiA/AmiB activator)